jgi:hypothetical protein
MRHWPLADVLLLRRLLVLESRHSRSGNKWPTFRFSSNQVNEAQEEDTCFWL